jgi:hypothetical protein
VRKTEVLSPQNKMACFSFCFHLDEGGVRAPFSNSEGV